VRKFARWTPEEDRQLERWWGVYDVLTLAEKMNRTPGGIVHRATVRGFPIARRETWTLTQAAAHLGLSGPQVRRRMADLRMVLQRAPRTQARHRRRPTFFALTEEQIRVLETDLRARPARTLGAGLGCWDHNGAPSACVHPACATPGLPHRARGLCTRCYGRVWMAEKRRASRTVLSIPAKEKPGP
jgi:hypothetical protein